MKRLAVALLGLYVALLGASSIAAADPVVLAPRVTAESLKGNITALRDPGGGLTAEEAVAALDAGEFAPVTTRTPDFGFTSDAIWLALALENPTTEAEWILRLRENFLQQFTVWQREGKGPPVLLESHDETTPFDARGVPWAELAVAFVHPTGETRQMLLRYRSGGSTEVELSFFSAPTFAEWTDRLTARNFIYYGMLMFLILASLATWAATRQAIFLAYSSYAVAGLLFVMHGDGNTFRYLWPDAPGLNAFASAPLGAAIVIFGANFARQFLDTARYHRVFDKLLLATIWVTAAMLGATAFFDTQLIKKLLVLMAFFSMVLFLLSGLNAARTRLREVRFFVIAWSGAVISSAIMTGRHWLGLEISEEVQFDSMRIVFVLDAALMGLAILDRFNALRRSRSEALESSLAQAERNLSLSRRLQTLEQRYTSAVDLARSREQHVADTMHDLRQPLHALRLNVQALLAKGARAGSASQTREIEETFGFLESLVTEELDTRIQNPTATRQLTANLDEIMRATGRMFAADAAAKGLSLTVEPINAQLRLPPIALMRILCNLVSNAVRYTQAGSVMLRAHRDENGLRVEVCDTGPGLSEKALERALPRTSRLDPDAAEGSGLGLDIVAQTCAAHGLALEWLPPDRPGTRIGIKIGPEFLVNSSKLG